MAPRDLDGATSERTAFIGSPLGARLLAVAVARSAGAGPAHDALHVQRVARMASRLATLESADAAVAVSAALLHELVNLPKDHPQSPRSGELCAVEAARVLEAEGCGPDFVARVAYAIEVHPYSLGVVPSTLEAKILQDADRLDAIGAVGIARCFATCAELGRPLHHPDDPMCRGREPDDKRWGVDHFFRKLLRVGEGLHTPAAKALARERTDVMRRFLAALDAELSNPV